MKITELILQKVEAIGADATGTTAEEVRSKAVAATLGGIGSPEWLEYMGMFTETDEQLRRLTSPPGLTDSPELRKALAYLVASGAAGVDAFLKLKENQQALSILDVTRLDSSLSGDSPKKGKP